MYQRRDSPSCWFQCQVGPCCYSIVTNRHVNGCAAIGLCAESVCTKFEKKLHVWFVATRCRKMQRRPSTDSHGHLYICVVLKEQQDHVGAILVYCCMECTDLMSVPLVHIPALCSFDHGIEKLTANFTLMFLLLSASP
eukprot:m.181769 g.181769  ORF g.181769 m.181769 type:complete len:138 (+) comp15378_c7_seq9:1927-2340(+)